MGLPKYLRLADTTRSVSKDQETRIARLIRGRETINSGATFGQNDIIADWCEVECKTTSKGSFRVSSLDWNKMAKKAEAGKVPIFVVEFQEIKKDLAVLRLEDLQMLIELANQIK